MLEKSASGVALFGQVGKEEGKRRALAELTREEFVKIVTWIDANAPFYGTHDGKKNLQWKGEPDFRPLPVARK